MKYVNPPKEMKNILGPPTALHGSVALPFVIPSEAEGSAVLQAYPGNVFRGSGLGFEARRACPELVEGATAKRQPGRKSSGIDSPTSSERRRRGTLPPQPASVLREKHSQEGPQNCRSLGCARDDKGEGDASLKSGCQTGTVFISTRDDNCMFLVGRRVPRKFSVQLYSRGPASTS
jgi:hypothetical protein